MRPSRLIPLDVATTALIYTRVSTDEQGDEGVSLPAQVSECRRYVSRMAWDFGDELQDVETGRRDDRPDYQRLLATVRELARAGTPSVVVVASLDRLGRSLAERVRAYEELQRVGVPIHSVREGGIVSELSYNILAAVAQEESRKLGERVRASGQYVAERGFHVVGRAPWGYGWRPATPDERALGAPSKVLDVHPIEAPYVREAWDRLAAGEALQSIARWVAGLPHAARGGRNLRFTAVRMLLRAPVYVARHGARDGHLDDVLTRPLARWPALISDTVWEAARRSIALASKMPRQASGVYPLSGLLRCYRCGARMNGRTDPPDEKRRRRHPVREYVCSGQMEGARRAGVSCYTVVMADPVEHAVLATVREILAAVSRPRVSAAIRRGWAERERRAGADDGVRRIADLDRELSATRRRISALSVKFLDDEIDRAAYDITRADLAAALTAAEAERARLQQQARPTRVPAADAVFSQLHGWVRALTAADPTPLRQALGDLIVQAEPVRVSRGRYEAHIDWTPAGWALLWAAGEMAPSENLVSVEHYGQTKCSTPMRGEPQRRRHRRPPIM